MIKHIITYLSIILSFVCIAQQPTVGLTYYNEDVSDGYILFTPFNGNDSYLIDNCGKVINTWQSNGTPNFGVYVNKKGELYRVSNQVFEIRDWDNNVIWSYPLNSNGIRMHHDFVVMPNNNIMMLAKDPHNAIEALNLGKDSIGLYVNGLLANFFSPLKIVELEPVGTNDANIVWEWKAWNHLIQNKDSSLSNYALLEDNPGKLDLNLEYPGNVQPTPGDWMHSNGINYNETLDQVVFSSRHFSEIYLLDHSTTTTEAAGNVGGNYNKGGQFLWRWGNPQNYNTGTANDKKFFGQHNPRWIKNNYPNGGKISVYNNGNLRPQGAYSSVEIVTPQTDANGAYLMNASSRFLPNNVDFTWSGMVDGEVIFSDYISSVEFLENGNYFINQGGRGRFMEFDANGNVLWTYINPAADVITTQGLTSNFNWVFKTYKLALDYFDSEIDLTPSYFPIESANTTTANCNAVVNFEDFYYDLKYLITANHIKINSNTPIHKITLLDLNGNKLKTVKSNQLNISNLSKGLYVLMFEMEGQENAIVKKVVL